MRIWVVLPAFNEAENLPALFRGLIVVHDNTYNLDIHVLVVDDGSTDETAAVAGRDYSPLTVEVLRNGSNCGLAETFMRGMIAAAEKTGDDDIILCMDADNTHLPGQLLQMTRKILEGRDVVIASRYRPGAVIKGVPFSRQLMSLGMSFLFRTVFPIPGVRDYSCGYRAYRGEFLKRAIASQGPALFSGEGFACMVALILRLHRMGAIFGEVPIVLRYDQKAGQSKMQMARTIWRTLSVLARERLRRT